MFALEVKRLEASIANGPNLDGLALEPSKADDTCSINQQNCGGKVEIDEMDIECDAMEEAAPEQVVQKKPEAEVPPPQPAPAPEMVKHNDIVQHKPDLPQPPGDDSKALADWLMICL